MIWNGVFSKYKAAALGKMDVRKRLGIYFLLPENIYVDKRLEKPDHNNALNALWLKTFLSKKRIFSTILKFG